MNSRDLEPGAILSLLRLIEQVLTFLAYCLGAVAAFLVWLSRIQDPHGKARLRGRFEQMWYTVHASGWLDLPHRVIFRALRAKDSAIGTLVKALTTEGAFGEDWATWLSVFSGIAPLILLLVLPTSSLVFLTGFDLYSLRDITLIDSVVILPSVLFAILSWRSSYSMRSFNSRLLFVAAASEVGAFILVFGSIPAITVLCVLTQPPGLAFILTLLFLPGFVGPINVTVGCMGSFFESSKKSRAVATTEDREFVSYLIFFLAVGVSFSATIGAIAVGEYLTPSRWLRPSAQLLATNAFFDGLTLLMTFRFLSSMISETKLVGFTLATIQNAAVASAFAVASLWVGLLATDKQLPIADTLWIFIGRTLGGDDWEFGPAFWVMHTTFIPTVGYLFMVLMACLAKSFVGVMSWFLERGKQEWVDPLAMTGGFVAFIAALCALLAYVLRQIG